MNNIRKYFRFMLHLFNFISLFFLLHAQHHQLFLQFIHYAILDILCAKGNYFISIVNRVTYALLVYNPSTNFSSSTYSIKASQASETWSIALTHSASASSIFFIAYATTFLRSSKNSGGVLTLICTSKFVTFFRTSSAISPSQLTLLSRNISYVMPSSAKFVHARDTILSILCLFSSYVFFFFSTSTTT